MIFYLVAMSTMLILVAIALAYTLFILYCVYKTNPLDKRGEKFYDKFFRYYYLSWDLNAKDDDIRIKRGKDELTDDFCFFIDIMIDGKWVRLYQGEWIYNHEKIIRYVQRKLKKHVDDHDKDVKKERLKRYVEDEKLIKKWSFDHDV